MIHLALFFWLGFLLGGLAFRIEIEREKQRSRALGRVFSDARRNP
jgi:hypothetical protein